MSKKPITMRELAERLGFSRTTVSLVLQGKGDRYRISRETQEKILEKAASLHYKPNYFASALNKGRTGVIGVVFPDVFESFMGRIARGIEAVLYEKGYTMMLSTSSFDNRKEKQIVEQFMYRGVDGFLIIFAAPFTGRRFDYSHLAAIKAQDVPMVLIDRYLLDIDVPKVTADDYVLTRDSVSKLIADGTKRIVCISFDLDVSTLRERMRGYADAIKEANASASERISTESVSGAVEPAAARNILEEEYILLSRSDPESNDLFQAVANCMPGDHNLCVSRDRYDGDNSERCEKQERVPDFFVTTSGLADKTAWILKQLNYRVGRGDKGEGNRKTIKIVRFGKTPRWQDSGMIDIPQPHETMGRRAASMLLEVISDSGY